MRTISNRRGRLALKPCDESEASRQTFAEACRENLLARFRRVRKASIDMCRPLDAEVFRIQPSEEVSPPWWNLGHTSWFFVRNVLQPFGGAREPQDDDFDCVLNSYYASLGERIARARRGTLTRPTTDEIFAYRASVDRRVEELALSIDDRRWPELAFLLTVGMNHEQQHQELFYTEVKSILAQNPPRLRAAYLKQQNASIPSGGSAARFVEFAGGLVEFGHASDQWCWDNELPRHKYYLYPFALADRLVTNSEYVAFMDDEGYRRQLLWLDNGWSAVEQHAWQAPLYWEQLDGGWWNWTLGGRHPLVLDEPVCHISFYEADAFARWSGETFAEQRGARLPAEREWECAARSAARGASNEAAGDAFLDSGRLHPSPVGGGDRLRQMFGVLWQWTSSYYEPYPGYEPFRGALAEYNGKFMDNQRVLRGGSCVTPRDHFRVTYRNFWPSTTRFQFTGIRLARNLEA
ncbi:MAG: ergothioneine biosynthesis protein EgtB [Pirellulales bacterium]